jgi:hypothetical protein
MCLRAESPWIDFGLDIGIQKRPSFGKPPAEGLFLLCVVLTDTRDAIERKKGVFSSERTQEPLFAHKQRLEAVSE